MSAGATPEVAGVHFLGAEMVRRNRDVVVLCWNMPALTDRCAHEIAQFLGASTTYASVHSVPLDDREAVQNLLQCTCLIVAAETLAKAADAIPGGVGALRSLTDLAESIFIYGFEPIDRHAAILEALSSGGLLGVQPLPNTDVNFEIAKGCREWCGEFSGLSLPATRRTTEHFFLEGSTARRDVVVRAGGKPFFVRMEQGRSQLFFLACGELADLDEKVPRGSRLLAWFSKLVPLMMFLRGGLGDRVWRGDRPRACVIIDDPLLKKRYGFLEYRRLVELMRGQRFSTCFAFIPWNYRRSSKAVAQLLSSNGGSSGLCVHGCDHTGGEFATSHFESLCGKAQLALERMRAHYRLYGVPFDEVMVFPQGLFSSEAIKALAACGYLAAVNTDLSPSDEEGVTLRDLLDVAVTAFADFPLFGRHYPRDPADFAFDLFLGKPALVAEHHGYFRNGYATLGAFVERLNQLDPRLEWSGLGAICSRACLKRMAPDDEVHVRFYTNYFQLTNNGPRTQRYVLFRRRKAEGSRTAVTVNGRLWPQEQDDDSLTMRLSLDAGQTADIRVSPSRADQAPTGLWKPSGIHQARVLLRRVLCEVRDNHIETNRWLAGFVSAARRLRARRNSHRLGATSLRA